MWGNWTWHLVRGDLQLSMDLADEMMQLAGTVSDRGMAHGVLILFLAVTFPFIAATLFSLSSGECGEKAIARGEDLEQCRIWSGKTGQNAAVVVRCYLAQTLWHLGCPEQALKLTTRLSWPAR